MRNVCCGLVLLLAAGILFSCRAKTNEKKFFDIPEYFRREINTITTHFYSVAKTSVYNGDTIFTQSQVKQINWEKELALFIECDINKPVYYANMKKDISPNIDTERLINESTAPIKSVELHYGPNGIFDLLIEIKKENIISSTSMKLSYLSVYPVKIGPSLKNYRIEGNQHIKGLNTRNSFLVDGYIQ